MFPLMKVRFVLWMALALLVAMPVGASPVSASVSAHQDSLVAAARARTEKIEIYDGSYKAIAYPNGDVADGLGVCSDLVIRAYRTALNIDLQVLVHEDMRSAFKDYPKLWGLKAPDRNIDHRRVPNLQRFFSRAGAQLKVSTAPEDYRPGDLVTWVLPGNLPHIGIVSDKLVTGTNRPLILHNIGRGPKEEDALFSFPITGHYRYKLNGS